MKHKRIFIISNAKSILYLSRLANEKACKHLWKCAVEHHSFFRLRAPVKGPSARQNFFRMGSRFRYSGHTEFQNAVAGGRARRTVSFVRTPSQRYARRQSHVLREKKKTEEKTKDQEARPEPAAAATAPVLTAGPLSKPAVVDTPRDSAPSPTLVLNLSASPSATPRSKSAAAVTSPRSHLGHSPRDNSSSESTPRAALSLPSTARTTNPSTTTEAESRLDMLINIKKEEKVKPVQNNQIPSQPARPLPAESFKNNLLKARAEEENKADLKARELNTSIDNVAR